MNGATDSSMGQMAETVWLNGETPIRAIFDPIEFSTSRMAGGKQSMAGTTIFLQRGDRDHYNIKKGDKISVSHGNSIVRVRVEAVNDDGTTLIPLTCGPLLKGATPGL
tara:strand:- start:1204 stop:1527 length:324 start_codon:yes stop_codon:yes gene_type:complete